MFHRGTSKLSERAEEWLCKAEKTNNLADWKRARKAFDEAGDMGMVAYCTEYIDDIEHRARVENAMGKVVY